MFRFIFCLFFLGITAALAAQSTLPLWQDAEAPGHPSAGRAIVPKAYRVLRLDAGAMLQRLAGAPDEQVANAAVSTYTLELPRPDGRMESFRICASPIMAPGLAKRFPQIRTYLGKGVDNPTALLRMDYTPHGFHAMVLAGEQTYFIDPYYHLLNDGAYLSYFKTDYSTDEVFHCAMEEEYPAAEEPAEANGTLMTGEELRTHRLAVSATGEYTQYHGGTVEGAMAAIATTMNRVNGVYERDLSVRMILVDSNHLVVFLNPGSDPFSGSDLNKRNQNQTTLDQIIGSANYDVGHVFDRGGGGGVASIETVCRNGDKGLGYTGGPSPVGDPYDIDYVAHELGHQYGGLHTFNYCDGSQGERPYEPGSATTIMGYAGICGSSNIANNSNDHFHVGNLVDMLPFVEFGWGNACAEKIPTENTPPSVEAGQSGLVIPISTPFELTATATDMEGDSLTYSWEQFDLGPGTPVNAPEGNAPLFRSYALSASPTRVFPRMASIVNNTQPFGERLPDYARSMNFRATVRDNHGFGGGVAWDGLTLAVSGQAGPFQVLSQNTSTTWDAGSYQLVEWDVANTDQAPVNAGMVNISLSMDGGFTYPILLADSLANDGSELVFIPDSLSGNQFRVKVKAVGNVFFDINNRNITISPATEAGIALGAPEPAQLACGDQPVSFELWLEPVLGFAEEVSFTIAGLPDGVVAEIQSPVTAPAQLSLGLSNLQSLASGLYPFQLTAAAGAVSETVNLVLELYAQAPGPVVLVSPVEGEPEVSVAPELSWEAEHNAVSYRLEVALDAAFSDIFWAEEGITETAYQLPTPLPDSATVYWRVRAANPGCGEGEYSVSFFETEVITCQVFRPDNLPQSLSVPAATVESIIRVEDDVIIRDVNIIHLYGFHVPVSDLDISLVSPEGTEIALATQDCEVGISFEMNLDDAAPAPLPCPYSDNGTYRPEEELKAFNGQSARGDWRLLLTKGQDNGSLRDWALEICFPKPLTGTKEGRPAARQLVVFPNPAKGQLTITLPEGLPAGARLRASNATGQVLLEYNVKSSGGNEVLDIGRLPQGLYFLQLFSAEGQVVGNSKFVATE